MPEFLLACSWCLALYYAASNAIYCVLLVNAALATRERRRSLETADYDPLRRSPFTPPIAILAPARNEEKCIVESVQSFLALDYPALSVIVINDGSTDGTLSALKSAFDLVASDIEPISDIPTSPVRGCYLSLRDKRLIVIDKVSGGRKADALNAGLNVASAPYVCALDTDAVLEKDALLSIMAPVLNDPVHVVASGGLVRVANGCVIKNGEVKDVRLPRSPIEILQTIEYLRCFLIARQGWARLDMLLIISGAFGVFRRDLCRAIGGFRNSAIGEDLDIVIRLHRHLRTSGEPYRIAFIPDPVCWTEAPSQISALASQRARWQNGLAEALCRHRDMIGNSRYGRIGLAALPYQCIFELCAPAVEVVGWLALGASVALGCAEAHCLAAFLAGYVFACLLSAGSLLLEELIYHRYSRWGDLARLVGWCLVEPVVYQGLNTIWRLRGLVDFVTGNSSWKSQPRVGFGPAKG